MNTLAITSVNKLTAVAGNIGILVMLSGFGDCINYLDNLNKYNASLVVSSILTPENSTVLKDKIEIRNFISSLIQQDGSESEVLINSSSNPPN